MDSKTERQTHKGVVRGTVGPVKVPIPRKAPRGPGAPKNLHDITFQ
jgi:hypothetical protein